MADMTTECCAHTTTMSSLQHQFATPNTQLNTYTRMTSQPNSLAAEGLGLLFIVYICTRKPVVG